ncbi:hypothetical protein BKA67DRAFT_587090 [Truncatella angustata]|uniref:EF-hand domain-containing protein n=1 Tax=Truncatella angustata TaxID=152316 RepID=A0A9P8RKW6_9PEZI|nr:uncharacterized protein BKA67DRAFT_587090 [Truncatella angustata]KAH6645165.1 hypothetical protein BKA67DRAFT_587090 [Truncatella angustata]KAH8199821.1 hypothetical protein TruAng_005991 [Truncatella angustata]
MARYTREEIKKWKKVFHDMNADGDRYIEPQEVINAAKKDGIVISDQDAEEYIQRMDTNNNGKVEFSEFIKVLGVPQSELK